MVELSDVVSRVERHAKIVANTVYSSFRYPHHVTELDTETGDIIRHYKPEGQSRLSLSKFLRGSYLMLQETFCHPGKTSEIIVTDKAHFVGRYREWPEEVPSEDSQDL